MSAMTGARHAYPFKISMIAAMSKNRAIGRGNDLPWNVPEDLKHFKDTTRGHPVLMGRKTFESMPGPLPARLNVVVTRQADYPAHLQAKGFHSVVCVSSIEEGLKRIAELKPECRLVFIGGGSEIYRQALGIADEIILTTIDLEIGDADAFFPEFEVGPQPGQFCCVKERASQSDHPRQHYAWFERR
jgi:dihydrofolate reductase